jgi:hypothetical protein
VRLDQPEILSVARDVYQAVYGVKVPKCVQAEKPSESLVKQFQFYAMKGRIHRPSKEQNLATSRIVIGGLSRKID